MRAPRMSSAMMPSSSTTRIRDGSCMEPRVVASVMPAHAARGYGTCPRRRRPRAATWGEMGPRSIGVRNRVLVELAVERLAIQPEGARGGPLVAPAGLENPNDVAALDL